MADVELLPLPRWMETYRIPGDDFHTGPDQYLSERMQSYARANLAPLQAENERLREQLRLATVDQATAEAEASDAHAENERLRAEVERLRADRDSWEQQASDRVADWHAEHLRAERLAEALRRAHRWGGLGKGWDSGVALDLIAWIESGMHGELPLLPDYLAAALAQENIND